MIADFLESMLTRAIGSSEDSPYFQVSAQAVCFTAALLAYTI